MTNSNEEEGKDHSFAQTNNLIFRMFGRLHVINCTLQTNQKHLIIIIMYCIFYYQTSTVNLK